MKRWDTLALWGSGGGRGARKTPICMIQMCFGWGPRREPIYQVWVGAEGPWMFAADFLFYSFLCGSYSSSFSLFLFERLSTSASTLKITDSSSSLRLWSASLNSQTGRLIFWHVYKHHVTHVSAHISLLLLRLSGITFSKECFHFHKSFTAKVACLCVYIGFKVFAC